MLSTSHPSSTTGAQPNPGCAHFLPGKFPRYLIIHYGPAVAITAVTTNLVLFELVILPEKMVFTVGGGGADVLWRASFPTLSVPPTTLTTRLCVVFRKEKDRNFHALPGWDSHQLT